VIGKLAAAAADATKGRLLLATLVLLWASAVLAAIVNNIPYVATMSPVVAELVHAAGGTAQAKALWWALALGADLGGNAAAVGASANVVILGLAERSGRRISFLGVHQVRAHCRRGHSQQRYAIPVAAPLRARGVTGTTDPGGTVPNLADPGGGGGRKSCTLLR
jgi:hypothetical protein